VTGREVGRVSDGGSSLQPRARERVAVRQPGSPVVGDVRFVPARWLLVLLEIVKLIFPGGRLRKVGIASLVWSFTPRPLKIAAAGLAIAATVIVLGALAGITLLVLQLS
jgi:hypothetical protein